MIGAKIINVRLVRLLYRDSFFLDLSSIQQPYVVKTTFRLSTPPLTLIFIDISGQASIAYLNV